MNLEPDRPRPFGYKIAWLAVRTNVASSLAATLGLNVRPATWAEGIAAAYQSSVFLTPPLANWTLAVGKPLAPLTDDPSFVKPVLERLSRRFGDAQYFCTHRVVEAHVWARALRGQLVRGYGFLGERGETLWDEGRQTNEEAELGFRFFDERLPEAGQDDYWSRKDLTIPNESHVMRIASRWSIDPSCLDEQFQQPSLGMLGVLNKGLQGAHA